MTDREKYNKYYCESVHSITSIFWVTIYEYILKFSICFQAFQKFQITGKLSEGIFIDIWAAAEDAMAGGESIALKLCSPWYSCVDAVRGSA